MKITLGKHVSTVFIALIMFAVVACSDDATTPPIADTAVNIENPATLVGNYEMISFSQENAMLPLATDNLSQIQSFKGQSTIEIIGNKMVVKSKVQLESSLMDALASFAGDQTFQLTNYQDNYSLAPDATYDPATQSIHTADNKMIIKYDNVTGYVIISSSFNQIVDVTVTVQLKKVNDAVIGLSNERYWLNKEKLFASDGTTINPNGLTSYYRIVGTDTGSAFTESADGAFRGNLSITFDIGTFTVAIYYKFQDPANDNASWRGYRYGVVKYKIERNLDLKKLNEEIVGIFTDLGANVTGEKAMTLTLSDKKVLVTGPSGAINEQMEFLPPLLGTGEKLIFKLEKQYDGMLLGLPRADQHPIVNDAPYHK